MILEPESDDHFAFIAGYTSGGTPYGTTWEEQEEITRECKGGMVLAAGVICFDTGQIPTPLFKPPKQ